MGCPARRGLRWLRRNGIHVVTALGRAVLEQGHGVQVIVPKYDCINYDLVG